MLHTNNKKNSDLKDSHSITIDRDFEDALRAWKNPPISFHQEHEITFPSFISIPPQPNPSMILDLALTEEMEAFSMSIGTGVHVNRQLIEREHGSMEVYLRRLLAQVMKRRWF